MMRSRLWRFAALVPVLVVAGCAASPPVRLYVLGDPPTPALVTTAQSGRPVIQLLPVSVPNYLDTTEILVRSGRNEVKASPTGRWAERLSVGVTHALSTTLITRLPGVVIITDPPIVPPAQQIMIDVQAFEVRADGYCGLTAQWTVSNGNSAPVLRRERDS